MFMFTPVTFVSMHIYVNGCSKSLDPSTPQTPFLGFPITSGNKGYEP